MDFECPVCVYLEVHGWINIYFIYRHLVNHGKHHNQINTRIFGILFISHHMQTDATYRKYYIKCTPLSLLCIVWMCVLGDMGVSVRVHDIYFHVFLPL